MNLKERIAAASTGNLLGGLTEEEKQKIHLRGKLAAAILNKRHELRLTQAQCGILLNISQEKVVQLENGECVVTQEEVQNLETKLKNSDTNSEYHHKTECQYQ